MRLSHPRRIVVLVAALALVISGCTDMAGPADSQADVKGPEATADAPSQVQAIFTAAKRDVPIAQNRGYAIGIPDATRTADRAEVVYVNRRIYERYVIERDGQDWVRGPLLERRKAHPPDGGLRPAVGSSGSPKAAPEGGGIFFSGYDAASIATIYKCSWDSGGVLESNWFINDTNTQTGWWVYTRQYQTPLPCQGAFSGGSEAVADTTYSVEWNYGGQTGQWGVQRFDYPTGNYADYCSTTSCNWSGAFVDSVAQGHGAQEVDLRYHLTVTRPVSVSIGGPDSISGIDPTGTWTASANGGTGSGFSYTWEWSTDGSVWTQVGTGSSYSRTFSESESNSTFYLRVTAASGGKSAQDQLTIHTYTIRSPLTAGIGGPGTIDTTGTYTWRANVGGGTPPYSYQWHYCEGTSCSLVSTDSTYTSFVATGQSDFTLNLDVDDSGVGSLSQSAFAQRHVKVAGNGGPQGPTTGNDGSGG